MSPEDFMKSVLSTAQVEVTDTNYFLMGLGGEVGEVLNKWKKVLRGDDGGVLTPERRLDIIYELGDVFWYLFAVCASLEIAPEIVMDLNSQKLQDRKNRNVLRGDGDKR